jgi:hypothetical protein
MIFCGASLAAVSRLRVWCRLEVVSDYRPMSALSTPAFGTSRPPRLVCSRPMRLKALNQGICTEFTDYHLSELPVTRRIRSHS